jgi:hypothetical protein
MFSRRQIVEPIVVPMNTNISRPRRRMGQPRLPIIVKQRRGLPFGRRATPEHATRSN